MQSHNARTTCQITLGNIVGGAVFVGLVYWFVYLYPEWAGDPFYRVAVPPRPSLAPAARKPALAAKDAAGDPDHGEE